MCVQLCKVVKAGRNAAVEKGRESPSMGGTVRTQAAAALPRPPPPLQAPPAQPVET